jgi:hypothetical protein
VLLSQGLVADQPKPLGGPFQRSAKATAGRLLPHHPEAPTRERPVMGEPQEVEALFASVPWLIASVRTVAGSRPGGSWSDGGQSVFAETLRQDVQDPASVLFVSEHHDKIVAETLSRRRSSSFTPRTITPSRPARCWTPAASRSVSRLKIYPPIGHTVDDGHDFLHLAVDIWEPDVFASLDDNMRR